MAKTMAAEKLVNKKLLSALVKEGVKSSGEARSVSGAFGERVKSAVENGNLNKKAFNIALGLAKMGSEQARKQALKLIPVYIDMLREEGVFPAEHVGDLVDDAEQKSAAGGEEDEDESDEPADSEDEGEADPDEERRAGIAQAMDEAEAGIAARQQTVGDTVAAGEAHINRVLGEEASPGINGEQLAQHLASVDPNYKPKTPTRGRGGHLKSVN